VHLLATDDRQTDRQRTRPSRCGGATIRVVEAINSVEQKLQLVRRRIFRWWHLLPVKADVDIIIHQTLTGTSKLFPQTAANCSSLVLKSAVPKGVLLTVD